MDGGICGRLYIASDRLLAILNNSGVVFKCFGWRQVVGSRPPSRFAISRKGSFPRRGVVASCHHACMYYQSQHEECIRRSVTFQQATLLYENSSSCNRWRTMWRLYQGPVRWMAVAVLYKSRAEICESGTIHVKLTDRLARRFVCLICVSLVMSSAAS